MQPSIYTFGTNCISGGTTVHVTDSFPLVQLPSYKTNKDTLDLEGSRPQVRQVDGVVREERRSLLVGDGGVDDDIVTLLPVDGGGDAVLVTKLKS